MNLRLGSFKMVPKTFLEALTFISTDLRKSKSFLKDKRLTQEEKEILSSYQDLSHNLNHEIIKKFSDLSSSTNEYIYAQRHLLLAIAYNNLSLFKPARQHLLQSLVLLDQQQLPYYQFIALCNLFIIENNTKNIEGMKVCLDKLKKIKGLNPSQVFSIKRSEFNFYTIKGDFPKAQLIYDEIEAQFDELSDSDQIGHLIDVFDFFIKQDKFDDCFDVLEKMKNHRNYNLKENYNFMKKLLLHFTKDAPIYTSENDFQQSPLLDYQVKVIQFLSSGEKTKALDAWNKLISLDPDTYKDHFCYSKDKCLFSINLKKHIEKQGVEQHLESLGDNKLEILKNIFSHSNSPIAKDELYKLLWGQNPNSKEDLVRLSRSIYRLKQRYGIELKLCKGAYSRVLDKKVA